MSVRFGSLNKSKGESRNDSVSDSTHVVELENNLNSLGEVLDNFNYKL